MLNESVLGLASSAPLSINFKTPGSARRIMSRVVSYSSRPSPIGSATSSEGAASSNSRSRKVFSVASGNRYWIDSRCPRVIAMMHDASRTSFSESGMLRSLDMSIRRSARTAIACGLGGWPGNVLTPADCTRISARVATRCRNKPSAMGLRQTFPVQTNRIFLTAFNTRKVTCPNGQFKRSALVHSP